MGGGKEEKRWLCFSSLWKWSVLSRLRHSPRMTSLEREAEELGELGTEDPFRHYLGQGSLVCLDVVPSSQLLVTDYLF
jgi:hypothetical protein